MQLNDITKKMAKLDFEQKYRINDSDDEINELGKNINTMSDKLESTIKQLRETNSELEKDIEEKSKIDEMRKQFISDVSHELKTPIALIQGYAEGLVENVNADDVSRKYYAEVILDESNKMDKLVRQLLELMKLEYGKREFNNDTFNICELIQEVIRKCNVMLEEKGIKEVRFEADKKVNVYADEFYIEQAFTNYFTNAIKHTKEVNGEKYIEIKIEENCIEPKVLIVTDKVTDGINEIVKRLSGGQSQTIAGFQGGQVVVLEPEEIVRIYAANGKVYAEAEQGTYLLRLRLYEMEQRLANKSFVRISNGEIINLKKVKGFDLSFTGTICVSLSNGTVTYVSRRYVSKIRHLLGI